jgi:aspartokinase
VVLALPRAWRGAVRAALDAAAAGDRAASQARLAELEDALGALRRALQPGRTRTAALPGLPRLRELVEGAGLVGHASPRTRDAALAHAAAAATAILVELLESLGLPARRATGLPPAAGRHGRGLPRPDAGWDEAPVRGELLVLEGGFGADAEGLPLAYGEGGADLSAVALAARFGCGEVHIWTADDGILSADPSLVPEATPLSALSFAEARALGGFGGKALGPETLLAAEGAGLALTLANLRRPARRTRIAAQAPARPAGSVASVVYKEGLHLLRLPAEEGLADLARTDEALRAAGVRRFGAIAGPDGNLLILHAGDAAARAALAALPDGAARLSPGWALVALVGEGLRAIPGRALQLLGPCQLEPVEGLLAGSSPISVSFLVPEDRLANLIPRLHKLWVVSDGARRAS